MTRAAAGQGSSMAKLVKGRDLAHTLRLAREDARERAIDNMGKYKFDRFGYFAARWVNLNEVLTLHDEGLPNPFKPLIHEARSTQRGFDLRQVAREVLTWLRIDPTDQWRDSGTTNRYIAELDQAVDSRPVVTPETAEKFGLQEAL